MKKLNLKGCTTKEKIEFAKEVEIDNTDKEYRHLMGWHLPETEKIFSVFRADQL